jgi:sugar/nucleoside kinase (ribokinase family)
VDAGAPTATVVVLLDGDRTMLSDRGAAARLSPADLPDLAGRTTCTCRATCCWTRRPATPGLAALAAARAAGLTTSVDPQAAPALTPAFRDWVRGVDLLLPNAAELAAYGEPDGVGAVAVTDGPRPARWIDAGGVVAVRPPRVEVVDPTGAGDAFDAGVLVARLSGEGPAEALAAGCRAGAAAVGRRGARPPAAGRAAGR